MIHSSAMLFLPITAVGYLISAQAVSAAVISEGTSSSPDQIILITPDWRPLAAPENHKTFEAKPLQSAENNSPQSPLISPQAKIIKPVVSPPVITRSLEKPQVVPVMAPAPPPVWTAVTGSTLHKTVASWADREKYDVIWDAGDLDYPIVSPLNFRGSFEEAITQLFALYEKAERKFRVEGWRPQRLIKITERSQLDASQAGKSL